MQSLIHNIGARMVGCAMKCRGITRAQNLGILPRCLILEDEGRKESSGAIVCGLNPAMSKKEERNYYITHGASYESVVKFWNANIRDIPYYQKLRRLVDALNLAGPILWTDTVKCEKQYLLQGFSHYSFPDTVRRCTANYLHMELAACPPNWIAIGVGRDAFTTLSLLCPSRFVLGVPHCVGQRGASGQFDSLFIGDRLKSHVVAKFQNAQAEEPTGALWLTADEKGEISR